VESVEQLARTLADLVARTGPVAPAVLFAATFVEYVFPPFPGDTVVLLGAWYAVHGDLSWPAAFAAVTGGAMLGAWADWLIGRGLANRARRPGSLRWLDAERLARFETAYRRWGALLLIANRFMPGIRAFLFVAAGAARIPLGRVLLFGAISAALWNALLLAAGALVVQSLPDLLAMVSRYTRAAWILIVAAVVVLAARAVWRRRRAR